jgi:hypothetical protein
MLNTRATGSRDILMRYHLALAKLADNLEVAIGARALAEREVHIC